MSFSEGIKVISEPINKLMVPVATSAGETLQDVWDLVFGGFGTYVDKKRLTRLKALEEFKASLEEKIYAIPENQLQEPALSIVGPALEASKYYFEDKTIREMFANLIASSMNCEKSNTTHPCFTGIIQQMTALDAKNLALSSYGNSEKPIAEYRIKNSKGFITVQTNVFIENSASQNLEQQSISFSSLSRLGLLSISYETYLTDTDVYKKFEQTPQYLELVRRYSGSKEMTPDIARGLSSLTPLGEAFTKVCFSEI